MNAKNTTPTDMEPKVPVPETPGRMPLGARRLLLIGGLCIPVGLVSGPYLLGAQLLAVAGVVMVAVSCSYGPSAAWFWRWSWATAAAGALWIAFTLAYWASAIMAAESSRPAPGFAPVLFNVGLGCFVVMAGAAAAASIRRILSSRAQPVSTL